MRGAPRAGRWRRPPLFEFAAGRRDERPSIPPGPATGSCRRGRGCWGTRRAWSTPRCGNPRSSFRRMSGPVRELVWPSSVVHELETDALVDPALGLVARDADATHLARVRNVGAAVGLQVEADDLDGSNLLDPLGEQVDLRPDEVRDRERLGAWEHVDAHVA